ncbi:MAG: tetratricopeptide repeat protein [Candidatus Heimdallarchaeota archaeon]|nr:tetratricopeptide repeat protein [Candidatus Heimdallarchaeota archaeon]
MSEGTDEILEEVENLYKDGRFAAALERIEDTLENLWHENFNPEEILKFNIKKLSILVAAKEFDGAQLLCEQLLEDIEELDISFYHIDILLEKALICSNIRQSELCDDNLAQVEEALTLFKRGGSENYIRRNAQFNMVKGIHYVLTSKFFESIDFFEESLKENRKIPDLYGIADSLLWTGKALFNLGEYDTANSFWDQSFEIFTDLGYKRPLAEYYVSKAGMFYNQGILSQALETVSKSLLIFEELEDEASLALVHHRMGYIYKHSGNQEKALENYLKSKTIYERKNLVHEEAKAILDISGINRDMGDYEVSLKNLKEYYRIKEEHNDQNAIAIALYETGKIYSLKGELDEAEENYRKALPIAIEYERLETLSNLYYALGNLSQQKGDLEGSSKSFLQSLQLREQIKKVYLVSYSLKSLIQINLDLKLNKIAEGFLKKLLTLSKETENQNIAQLYRLSEALFLKRTGNEREIQKSAVFLEQLAKEEVVDYMITIESLLNLTEILIWEMCKTGEESLLEEVSDHLNNLESIAKRQNSFALLVEVMLLQAEFALVELKVDEAQNILTEALEIAEEKGIIKIAIKISNEHDNLLDQIDLWEDFTMKLPTIAEKLELSHIEDRLKQIVGRRSALGPEVESESELPVMFLMQSQDGIILYSGYFDENLGERIYDEVLLTIKNTFSPSVDKKQVRVKNKEFTFLIDEVNKIYVSYIFIGKSYNGIKKLNKFIEIVDSNKDIKKMIENAIRSNQSLNSEERTSLSSYIEEIFSN